MMNPVPLGGGQRFPLRPVPMYAYSGKGTECEGKSSFPSFAGLRGGVRVVEVKVRCVDCHCNFLGECKISKQSSTCTDSFIAGAAKMKGGSSRMVCLHIAFPLELRVAKFLNL